MEDSGRGAAWLARLLGVQEVPSSNLGGPTKFLKDLQTPTLFGLAVWSPTGVQKWTPGAPLPCTKKKAARFLSTSLILEKPAIPDIFPLSD